MVEDVEPGVDNGNKDKTVKRLLPNKKLIIGVTGYLTPNAKATFT